MSHLKIFWWVLCLVSRDRSPSGNFLKDPILHLTRCISRFEERNDGARARKIGRWLGHTQSSCCYMLCSSFVIGGDGFNDPSCYPGVVDAVSFCCFRCFKFTGFVQC